MLLLVSPAVTLAFSGTSCHIHPPGSTPQNPVNTVGPFDSVSECEQERSRQFGTAGYCHCSADFTPNWQRLDPGSDPVSPQPLM